MFFNSIEFCLFFPIVAILYFFITHKIQKNIISQILLLTSSLFFYACWNPSDLILILVSVIITYTSAILIEGYENYKKLILIIAILSNLLILFFFKYYNFFIDSLISTSILLGRKVSIPKFNFLLPVGISFYTFQALGYSIDVYNKRIRPERNFITYALFVTFFPQLVAGPIERTSNLINQFKQDYKIDYDRITYGLRLVAWGLLKKIVVADRLAIYVNNIYDNYKIVTGSALALATFFFSVQILCDFSGYSDIAIGIARILGFNLMKNFSKPYFARSIPEFWRRWHISLSTWLKDYIYIPMGGNRCSLFRRYFNIFVTFLISGLWHGAAWTYVIWGALHGFYQIVTISTQKIREKIGVKIGVLVVSSCIKGEVYVKWFWKLIQIFVTFSLTSFAWLFFRANSLGNAVCIAKKFLLIPREVIETLKTMIKGNAYESFKNLFFIGSDISGYFMRNFLGALFLITILFVIDIITINSDGIQIIKKQKWYIRWFFYYTIAFLIIFFGTGIKSEFIYFQF